MVASSRLGKRPLLWVGCWCAAALVSARVTVGLDARYYGVEVTCTVDTNAPALQLSWPALEIARQYTIRRRARPAGDWGDAIAVLPGTAAGYRDTGVKLGTAYEYEIEMQLDVLGYEGTFIPAYSYLTAGADVQIADRRGMALLVVDSSLMPALRDALARFEQDLVCAGWETQELEVTRATPAPEVKGMIQAALGNVTGSLRHVIVIGHVTVPYAGDIAPDLHASHRGAWPADSYYADLTGSWTDTSVSVLSEDSPANNNVPDDGKFDQSEIPAPISVALGRIDFADLPSFAPRSEIELLANYFQKNHDFRDCTFTAARRALLHDNFGDLAGDAPAVDGWRHFTGFFGPNTTDVVEPDALIPTLDRASYLWAYGCGGGSFSKADGVADTPTLAAHDPQAVFWILHGSYFGDWNTPDNLLRAAMATPHCSLVSIWSGLPHWYMHPLAMGSTVGEVVVLTQNNRGAYKSYRNFSQGQVHIALLGDPTLEMFPVAPPKSLSAWRGPAGVQLSWERSPDVNIIGYRIYSSQQKSGPYERIADTNSGTTTAAFADAAPFYLVRAVKREVSGSGTYLHCSQGAFSSLEQNSARLSITANRGQLQLDISGPKESPFRMEESTDAITWTVMTEGRTDSGGAAQIRAVTLPAEHQFYRLAFP